MAHVALDILQKVLDCVCEAVAITDAAGQFIFWNAAAREIVGVERANLDHSGPSDWPEGYGLYDVDTNELVEEGKLPLIRSLHGEEVRGFHVRIRSRAKTKGTLVTIDSLPLFEGKELIGTIAIFKEVVNEEHDDAGSLLSLHLINREIRKKLASC